MPTLFPTINDIKDDPNSHAQSLREIKMAIEQITGQRPGILLVFGRVFYSGVDPQKLPLFKGAAPKFLQDGDIWFDISVPATIKQKIWDTRTQTWQLVP